MIEGGAGLAWFLVASLVVIGLALWTTRWLARWQWAQGRGRRMRILEGLAVGRDRYLLLVQVGREVLLVGSAEDGVNLVHRIDDPEQIREWLSDPSGERPSTPDLSGLESAIRANLDRMRRLLTRNGGRDDA